MDFVFGLGMETSLTVTRRKTSFLVFKHQKYTTVPTDQIALFYIHREAVCLRCFDQREFVLNQSLDSIMQSVNPEQFYRVNRQYLINFKAIKEVEHYFMRKLLVRLVIEFADALLINKEKAPGFLSWMDDR
jgi:DNA-binding LytR/AlgR family response regulator